MKKVLVSVLIFLILTNFICINFCYADDEKIIENLNDGTAEMDGKEVDATSIGSSGIGTVIGIVTKFLDLFPMLLQYLITLTLNCGGVILDENAVVDDSTFNLFTIEDIITGKYLILDCNVFTDSSTNIQTKTSNDALKQNLIDLRTQIAMWFIIIRDISMALNLAVLLFIAIKLALATIAAEKAKYKELLYGWLVSMLVLFMLPYIFSVINAISDSLVNIAESFIKDMEAAGNESFETTIMFQVIDSFMSSGGLTYALYSIMYWVLTWTELKFFLLYGKRVFKVFFLIIISPIITVTYSIDKIGDGKAQAFSKWMSEYMNNLFIQPIHCFTYLVFMFTANDIAIQAPLVGIIFLISLPKAEQIVKKFFNLESVENVGDKFSLKGMTQKLNGMIPKGGGAPGGGK
jgi:hypothetical protein